MSVARSVSWVVLFSLGSHFFFGLIQVRYGFSDVILHSIQATLEIFVLSGLLVRVSSSGHSRNQQKGSETAHSRLKFPLAARESRRISRQDSEIRNVASQILNAAQASIVSYRMYPDRHWKYLYISPGCEAMFGYRVEELMADPSLWSSRVIPEDWDSVFLPIVDEIFNERNASLEYRFRHKDDTIRWISTDLTSCYDSATHTWVVTLVDVDISDRKAAEIALKASERKLYAIFNSSPYGIFLKDEQGRYTDVNPAYEQISQLSAAELIGKSDYDILPQTFAKTCEASDQAALAADTPIVFEESVPWQNGTRTLLITKFALQDVGGDRPNAVCGIILDITDRKTSELALQKSQQQYQTLVDSVESIVWELSPETFQFTFVSPQAEKILGYAVTEWLKPNFWANHVFSEDLEAAYAYCQRSIETGQDHQFEYRMIAADGRIVWIQDIIKLVYEDNRLVKLVGLMLDITDRKTTEEALHHSEDRFQAVFEQSTVGIALIDGTGRFLQVNAAYADITGYSPEELLQIDCWVLTHPDDREHSQRGMASVLAGEQASLSIEKRYLCKNGERWVSYSLCPILARHGILARNEKTLNFLTAIVVDITARKQAEQELIQRAEQEQAFNRVVQTIRSSLDLNTIFSMAVQEVSKLLELDRVAIVQYQAERQCWSSLVEYRSHPDLPDKTGVEIPDVNNPFAERLKRFEVVQIDSTEVIADPVNRAIAQDFPGAWLLTPLIVNDQLWGSFSFFKAPSTTSFSEVQVALARRVADQLAIAIQQSTLYTQLQEANQQLHHLATHDPLTQLANRRYFDDHLTREWSRLARSQSETWVSLIICDIDYFKPYNDCYGHLQGDDCLARVAEAMSLVIKRPTDIVARYGGEEFAMVLPATDDTGATCVVHKLQAAIASLELTHAQSPVSDSITLSFGIACFHKRTVKLNKTSQELFQIADEALYRAKQSGRNRYEVVIL